MNKTLILFVLLLSVFVGCKDDCEDPMEPANTACASSIPVGEDYELDIPFYVSLPPLIPEDNPIKVPAVELGRFLFWDTRLSANNTMSCGTCHQPAAAFSDPVAVSVGIDGISGERSAMAIVNLVFQPLITWDGHQPDLEAQSIAPVENVIEMHDDWDDVIEEIGLSTTPDYPAMFEAAYGTDCITRERASKAMASFMRTMISFNSKYDRARYGPEQFTPLENEGFQFWSLEGGAGTDGGGDCFHCHSLETEIFSDGEFRNNGLDEVFTDLGRGGVTGNPAQNGKFKVPTLRNIELTAPYMHDGRFETLEEVVDHYNTGGVASPTIDPFMEFQGGGLALTPSQKAALVAFMKTFTDTEFINNPAFQDPF
jgi:cytochrome c peroxidase